MSTVQKFKAGDYIIWDNILWIVLNTDNQMYELKLVIPRQFTTRHGNGGYMDSSVIDETATLYTISNNGGSKRITKKKRRSYKKGGTPDNTLYEITYKLAPSTDEEYAKIEFINSYITRFLGKERMNTFNTVTKFFKNISKNNPEAKPHNLCIKWYYSWTGMPHNPKGAPGLEITFDVKFDQPKTQEEVKTWFDKYFDYEDFNAKAIEKRI
jgi:hypothetical protein